MHPIIIGWLYSVTDNPLSSYSCYMIHYRNSTGVKIPFK